VDDGSRDATGEVLDEYARRCATHPLTVLHQQNAGTHDALNHGLALARGDWVALINSDDLYAATRLECCLKAMIQRNAAFAFSGTSFVNEAGAVIGNDDRYVAQLRDDVARGFRTPDPVYALIRSNIAISTGNFVFKRELLKATGGFCALRVCHDWDFILTASYHTQLVVVDQPLYIYRMHGANTFSDRGLSTRLEIEQLLCRFFHDIYRHPLLRNPEDRELFLSHVRDCGLEGFLPRM
jgi:glycosyltransferase involved in cell wall biosynthesis